MSVSMISRTCEAPRVAKKRAPDQPAGEGKSFSFRASPELAERIEATAGGLGLDASNLIRMVLLEHLHIYERRVKDRQAAERSG